MKTLIDSVRIEGNLIDPQAAFFYGNTMADLAKWDSIANDYRFCSVIDKAPFFQLHLASLTMPKGQGKAVALCVLAYRTLTANNGLGALGTQMRAIADLTQLIKNLAPHKWVLQGDMAFTPLFREPNFELTSGALASFAIVGSNSEFINCCD